MKDQFVKKVMEERDHYKYSTNPHYAYNSCDYIQPEKFSGVTQDLDYYKSIKSKNLDLKDENIQTPKKPSRDGKVKLGFLSQSDSICRTVDSDKSVPGSIINYFKNLFG